MSNSGPQEATSIRIQAKQGSWLECFYLNPTYSPTSTRWRSISKTPATRC